MPVRRPRRCAALPGVGASRAKTGLTARWGAVLAAVALSTGCAVPGQFDDPADLAAGAHDLAVHDLAVPAPDLRAALDGGGCGGGGLIVCGGQCVDPSTDSGNCGGCGQGCPFGTACGGGRCTCTKAVCPTGCCDGDTCRPGNTQAACGSQGAACAACTGPCLGGACAACNPGDTRQMACGQCGMQSQTCQANGQWGALGACTGEGPCMPGMTRTMPCGMCGIETDTCGNSCTWQTGACTGQGECAPGATQQGACDPCSVVTCDNTCHFGAQCALMPGAECEYQNGQNVRPCSCQSACSGTAQQGCLPSCHWSVVCSCCQKNVGCPKC